MRKFVKIELKEALIDSQIYILKSTLAGVIAFVLAGKLVPDDALSAAFVAILCIKPAFYTGLVVGKQQLTASLLGAILTALLLIGIGNKILVISLALVLVTAFCVYQKKEEYLTISVFTVLYMVILSSENTLEMVTIRMSSVFLGVVVASLINFMLSFFLYKPFLYFRIKYAVHLVYQKFIQAMNANISANEKNLEKLYKDFENIYAQLSTFSSEMLDLSQELKFRKKIGEIEINDLASMYQTIKNLKMVTRYVQDIAYISKMLVPEHKKIPDQWKEDLDKLWFQNRNTFERLIKKISNEEKISSISFANVDFSLLNEINEAITNSGENEVRYLYAKVMAIVVDFQQLQISLNHLDYFANQYIDLYKKTEN